MVTLSRNKISPAVIPSVVDKVIVRIAEPLSQAKALVNAPKSVLMG